MFRAKPGSKVQKRYNSLDEDALTMTLSDAVFEHLWEEKLQLELVGRELSRIQGFLGKITEMLYENDFLTSKQVIDLLDGDFEEVTDPTPIE